MKQFSESELILNADGSIYHLHLKPENIAETIITVGDPDRVTEVSKHFDKIEFSTQKREFVTHTGYIGNKRLTVISTGIGTDNIDIVFNELDALVNIDLENRIEKIEKKSLKIVRVGTSGTLQNHIPVDSVLLSEMGLGMDGLMNYYNTENSKFELEILNKLNEKISFPLPLKITSASKKLIDNFSIIENVYKGITISATGFYGPQGRILRAKPSIKNFIEKMAEFDFDGLKITNLEMETAGIYGLGKLLGHECLSVNVILANRQTGEFSKNGEKSVEKTIVKTLEILTSAS
jgi:uridine phosphorylase